MIAALVNRLIAAGVAPDMAAVTVAEAYAAGATSTGHPPTSALEKRRAYDRERMRRKRAKSAESTGHPPTSADSPQEAHTLTYSPHKDSQEGRKKVSTPKARKSELSDDWQPTQSHFDKAEEMKIPHAAVLSKAEDMRLWAKSTGALKVDWDATFHGFLRRDASKLREEGHGKTGNVIAAADRLLEKVRDFDRRPGIRDGTGTPPVRLLSSR